VVALLAALALQQASPASPAIVALAVAEPAGVARHAFPATASVPLPRGRLRDPAALWLAAPDRRPTSVQAHALERWPDGTLRWLLLDFLADVPANGETIYTLHEGRLPEALPAPRLRMETRRGERLIDTGPLRLAVREDGRTLLAAASTARARLPAPIQIPALGLADRDVAPPSPDRVQVEREGPVRTELLFTGRYPPGVAYQLRLAAFAGRPFVRVRHTLINVTDAPAVPIRSLALVVPGRFREASVGVDGSPHALESLAPPRDLVQADPSSVTLGGTATGRHGDGWARASGDGLDVTLVTPYFWQEYPMAFRLAPDRLALELVAGADSPVALGAGAAKTWEAWIAVQPAAGAPPAAGLAAALCEPLVALPPAAWIVASRALPHAITPSDADAREFLGRLAAAYARYREHIAGERWDDGPPLACEERSAERPRLGLYGALNWGDWQFPGYRSRVHGCDAWGNLEYDLPQVLGLAWAATAGRQYLDGLGPAARHYRDVDVIHHAPGRPHWLGFNHPHKVGHFSFATREAVDLGHTWAEGLVTYHRLTGDGRALAAARGIADALVPRAASAHNPRQFGWPMIALVAVHGATGEKRYLEAARAYAGRALATFPPTPAAGTWMMGILADGLAAVHAATGEEHLLRWLTAYADALVAAPDRHTDPRYALPLGYLAVVSGNRRYEERARATVQRLRIGGWGKPLAAMGRTGFRLLADLQQLPPGPAAPGPPELPGPPAPPAGEAPQTTGQPGFRRGPGAPRLPSRRARRGPSPSPPAPALPRAG
jgi:hypothetical protein